LIFLDTNNCLTEKNTKAKTWHFNYMVDIANCILEVTLFAKDCLQK
jgi:hypothetical protein